MKELTQKRPAGTCSVQLQVAITELAEASSKVLVQNVHRVTQEMHGNLSQGSRSPHLEIISEWISQVLVNHFYS